MTLKVSQVFNAAVTIEQMHIRHELPYRTVRALQQLKRTLKTEADNVRGEQVKLIDLYHGKVKEDGRIAFADCADLSAFEAAWNRLLEDDADMDAVPVDLSAYADFINFGSADADIEALGNFIKFERDES